MIRRNPVRQYFANIYQAVLTTLLGMQVTIGYFFRKPVTMQYPEVRPVVPPGARGLHEFNESACFACQQCAKACPVDCLKLEWEGRGKDVLITRYDIDYQRCLFCHLCCEPCPTHAISMSGRWDLASDDREGCIVHFARPKTPEEIEAFKAEFARKEAEKKKKAAEAKAQTPAAPKTPPPGPAQQSE